MYRLKIKLLSALSIICLSTIAQPEQGTLLLGLSSNIGGSSIVGISYESVAIKSNLSSFQDSITFDRISYNIGLKAAYFLGSRLAIGGDFYYGSSVTESENELFQSSRFIFSAGPFMRFYVPYRRGLLFYIEAAGSFGVDFNNYYTEGNFYLNEIIIETVNFSSGSLALGFSLPLTEKVFLDFAIAGNLQRSWDPDASQFTRYNLTRRINSKLGFSILLN